MHLIWQNQDRVSGVKYHEVVALTRY